MTSLFWFYFWGHEKPHQVLPAKISPTLNLWSMSWCVLWQTVPLRRLQYPTLFPIFVLCNLLSGSISMKYLNTETLCLCVDWCQFGCEVLRLAVCSVLTVVLQLDQRCHLDLQVLQDLDWSQSEDLLGCLHRLVKLSWQYQKWSEMRSIWLLSFK